MKIEITARNYEVSEHLKEVTASKLEKLDKYFDSQDTLCKVCLKKEASTLVTEIMLDYCGKLVRATTCSDNFYDNLDVILPKLEGQIRKHRTRFDKQQKNSAYKDVSVFDSLRYEKQSSGKVVKEKKFSLKPMTVDEAISELELLDHSFYVFLEAKTNTIQILYKRADGDLGLIEPQV